jgi:hypothetical protein
VGRTGNSNEMQFDVLGPKNLEAAHLISYKSSDYELFVRRWSFFSCP